MKSFDNMKIAEISENPRESARGSLLELHLSENPARKHTCLADARIEHPLSKKLILRHSASLLHSRF